MAAAAAPSMRSHATATSASIPHLFRAPTLMQSAAPTATGSMRSRLLSLPSVLLDGSTACDDSEEDDALLRDLIAPRRRNAVGTTALPGEQNLVSILAQRLLQANQAHIEARAAKAAQPLPCPRPSRSTNSNGNSSHAGSRAPAHDSGSGSGSGSASGSASEDENKPNYRGGRKRGGRRHRRKKNSAAATTATAVDQHSQQGRPSSPPTSSLSAKSGPLFQVPFAAPAPAKVDLRPSSYFFPNPHTAHLGTPSNPAPPSAFAQPPQQTAKRVDHLAEEPMRPLPVAQPPMQSAPFHPAATAAAPSSQAAFVPPVAVTVPSIGVPLTSPLHISRPAGQPHSPRTLAARAAHELRVLETLQASQTQLTSVSHAHALNVIQAETEKLAAMLASKEEKQRADQAREEQQRLEFIARTHALDAQREAAKQRALAEKEALAAALHQQQLHAQTQQALMLQELERAKTRAAEEAIKAAHALELERVRATAAQQADLAASQRAEAAQATLARQIAQREEQHAQALSLALTQAQSNGANFQQLHSLAQAMQASQKENLETLAREMAQAARGAVEHAVKREEKVLAQVAAAQARTVKTILEANHAASNALTKHPIQVQLLGGAGAMPIVAAPAPSPYHLQLPLASPPSSRRQAAAAAAAAAANRPRSDSLAGYSEDFDAFEQSVAATAAFSSKPAPVDSGMSMDEEYADDFVQSMSPKAAASSSARFKTPMKSPATSARQIAQSAQQAARAAAALKAASSSIDESIEFEDGVNNLAAGGGAEVASSSSIGYDNSFLASPIPPARGAAAGGVAEDDDIVEEDAALQSSSDGLGGRKQSTAVVAAGNLSQSHEYSTDEFATDSAGPVAAAPAAAASRRLQQSASADDYATASFVQDEAQNQRAPLQQQFAQADDQQQHYQQPHADDGYDYTADDQYDDGGDADAAAAAPVAAPDSPTPLLRGIDELLAQQQALLDARYASLSDRTRHQLGVLHAATRDGRITAREAEKRKLAIKAAFNAEKGAIAAQRAHMLTQAQAQKLAVARQAQELIAARTEAARWEARMERVDMGLSSESILSTPPRVLPAAATKRRGQKAAPSSDVEISFSSDAYASATEAVPRKARPAAAATAAASTGRRAASVPSKRAPLPVPATFGAADESASSSMGSMLDAELLESSSASGADQAPNPERERLRALQEELTGLRRLRHKASEDPVARKLARQEARLDATHALAERILAEKMAAAADASREQRIADKKKAVGRLLKEVQNVERERRGSGSSSLRSPRRPSPSPPHTNAVLAHSAHRSPRDKLLRVARGASPSPRRSNSASGLPTPVAAGEASDGGAGGEQLVDLSEATPRTAATMAAARAVAAAQARGRVLHDGEEVEVSFSEDDTSRYDHTPRPSAFTATPAAAAQAVSPSAVAGAKVTPHAPSVPHHGGSITPRAAKASRASASTSAANSRPGSARSSIVGSPVPVTTTISTGKGHVEEVEIEFSEDNEEESYAKPSSPSVARKLGMGTGPATVAASSSSVGASQQARLASDESMVSIEEDVQVVESSASGGSGQGRAGRKSVGAAGDKGSSTSAPEIDTEASSYAEDFVATRAPTPVKTPRDTPSKVAAAVVSPVPTAAATASEVSSEDYDDEQFAPGSPGGSSSARSTLRSPIPTVVQPQASAAAAAGILSHETSVAEELGASISIDYADSFVTNAGASTRGVPSASTSVAEEKQLVAVITSATEASAQYESSFTGTSDTSIGGKSPVTQSRRQLRARGGKALPEQGEETASAYSDSFHELDAGSSSPKMVAAAPATAASTAAAAVPATPATPTSPTYADSFAEEIDVEPENVSVGEELPAAAASSASASRVPSAAASAAQSLTHEQIDATTAAAAASAFDAVYTPQKVAQVFQPSSPDASEEDVDGSLRSQESLHSPSASAAAVAPAVTEPITSPKIVVSPASVPALTSVSGDEEDIEEELSASRSFGEDDEEHADDPSLRGVPVSPKAPLRALTLEERDHVLAEGPDAAAEFAKEPSPRNLAVPAASAAGASKPRAGRARLAELEAQAREQQDAADQSREEEAITSPAVAPASAPEATPSKEELVSAITAALLQDLARDLKESTSATQAAKRERQQRNSPRKGEEEQTSETAAPTEPATWSIAAGSASAVSDQQVIDRLQAELVADTLSEVERIEQLKRERAGADSAAASSVTTAAVAEPSIDVGSPVASSTDASPTSEAITSPPSPIGPVSPGFLSSGSASGGMSPLSPPFGVAIGSSTTIDSPLGLCPALPDSGARDGPGVREGGVVDDWHLDSVAPASSNLPAIATVKHEPTADELNAAVEAALAAKKAEAAAQARAQAHLAPAYVTQLLSSMFKMEFHALDPVPIRQAVGLEEEARARMLPLLREGLLPRVEGTLDEQLASIAPGADQPDLSLRSVRAAFHRLMLATANQYIDNYNDAVRRAELNKALPWGHAASAAAIGVGGASEEDEWHDSDEEDEEEDDDELGAGNAAALPVPLVFSLANSRVRRAPGGLVISLNGRRHQGSSASDGLAHAEESSEQQRRRWSKLVVRKVCRKVAQMKASTVSMQSAMAQAMAQASAASATAAGGASADASNSGMMLDPSAPSAEQRLHMQTLLDQETALVNSILARQMASIEPGPAGATQKDWGTLSTRGTSQSTAASAAAPTVAVGLEDSLDLTGISSYDDSMLSHTGRDSGDSSAHSSVLYSGSEAEWEGGYEAGESVAVVSELAEHVLDLLLEELVLANQAVEQKKYMRRLLSRARERDSIERQQQQQQSAGGRDQGAGASSHAAGASLGSSEDMPPQSPRDSAERKKARRQAIKL